MENPNFAEEKQHHHLSDPPYENYFYTDPTVSCQAVLASPLPDSGQNSHATHRLLFAWPAGNSGAAIFFTSSSTGRKPVLELNPGPKQQVLQLAKYKPEEGSRSDHPYVGVSGLLSFSSSATLSLTILGSIRSLRDYTEGHGILNTKVQNGVQISELDGQNPSIEIRRTWFDETTMTRLTFTPVDWAKSDSRAITIDRSTDETTVEFAAGTYSFQACVNYPQLRYMQPIEVLKPAFYHSIFTQTDAVKSLAFLCSSDKILAGGWRFLTYFGRDSMISLLLMNRILSEGENGAIEAGLRAVLERIDARTGSVCHEETIGDYPAAQAALLGTGGKDAQYDYKMVNVIHLLVGFVAQMFQVDTDYFLPILMKQYFVDTLVGQKRRKPFLR